MRKINSYVTVLKAVSPVVVLLSVLATTLYSSEGDSQYVLVWSTIDGGGGTSNGGQYVLTGTIGQPDAAYSAGGNYELLGGFWPGGPLLYCFPTTYTSYNDWKTMGKPNCWCGTNGTPQWPYQCEGDADGDVQGLPKYRVYTNDFNILVVNWKKLITDQTLNPCADFDHKPQGLPKYRVYTNDFNILVRNWKKTDSQLTGNCPRQE